MVVVNRYLRRLINIRHTDQVSNDVLLQQALFERVELTVLRRKWRLTGLGVRKSNAVAESQSTETGWVEDNRWTRWKQSLE